MNSELTALQKYFPEGKEWNWAKLAQLVELVKEWNDKVNVISRKDIDHLAERHLVPSLSLAKVIQFHPGTTVLDVGTGGGFPGLPLAVCFPEVRFTLVDSIGKKIKVVQSIADELGLNNVKAKQVRAEELKERFDFVIGRAVTALPRFMGWIQKKINRGSKGTLSNGVLYLKGGDMSEEFEALGAQPDKVYDLEQLFEGQFCESKRLLYFSRETVVGLKLE